MNKRLQKLFQTAEEFNCAYTLIRSFSIKIKAKRAPVPIESEPVTEHIKLPNTKFRHIADQWRQFAHCLNILRCVVHVASCGIELNALALIWNKVQLPVPVKRNCNSLQIPVLSNPIIRFTYPSVSRSNGNLGIVRLKR